MRHASAPSALPRTEAGCRPVEQRWLRHRAQQRAKALGIPMGAPFFEWRSFCLQHGVALFSSNYELYGDMSARVMTVLRDACPDMEIYSIDEAFLPSTLSPRTT
jgi:nucleotidyltransferase/DNA polymerase involved in DNA repair